MRGALTLLILFGNAAYGQESSPLAELVNKPTMLQLINDGYEIKGTVGQEPFSGQPGVAVIAFLQKDVDLFMCELGLSWGLEGYSSGPWNNDTKCKPVLVDEKGLSLTDGPSRYGFREN